ncbi:NlpC/P60 family protein [Clostridium sp. CCUG 7971]|uniref:C40 family peptidase n=1 Tax=Clostridium sp. CCUG 7971 TaxID=2811414 RepID=UPI001ABAF22E|nr:NlpC/P60 family protein [Clostridium sp. CCUG 7971]MBO3444011.1 C40 family peptidase [Clostridium sp. CCUG 7971]
MNNNIEIVLQNGNNLYEPLVEGDLVWETQRKGAPGKLSFNILKDDVINFGEGNAIRVKFNNKNIFYGFIFNHSRNKDKLVQVVAYDQLRYFKNKDTYIYENKTATEIVQMLAKDFNLNCGTLENTKFKIKSRVEEDKTLFDIVLNALDTTIENAKEMYILYDDFGQITLKNISSMKLDTLIDGDVSEDFDYSSSIDGNSYNKIKLSKDNKETGKREIYIAQDSKNINSWGILQYFESINENVDAKVKADALLKLYNQKVKSLNIKNVFGDIRVRAGCLVAVVLDLGDMKVQNYMLVDKVKHTINSDEHYMDLTLVGGEFVSTLASSSRSSGNSKGNSSSDNSSNTTNSTKGKEVNALFTAYYPANNSMEGGLYDAQGNRLNPKNKTCAAPKSIPFGIKIKVQGTGTSRDGEIYTVTDRGGAITVKDGVYHFDLLMSTRKECNTWGKKKGKAAILNNNQISTSSTSNSKKASQIITLAKGKLGSKYVWGATGPTKFDCSGFTSWLYKQAGITIPRTSRDQGKAGTYVAKSNLQPGDLIFFNKPISHVGLYIGDGQMIHASNPTRGVVKDNINSSHYKKIYNTSRRFL